MCRAGLHEPTKREAEVLRLICEGLTNNQISETLGITFKTVTSHRGSLMNKAGVNNSIRLFRWALKQRLVSIE
jgi:DNA-binding NarL/FixJ family response regulator